MRRLRKFIALNTAERAIVLRSLLLLPLVAALLRTSGMARTAALLERLRRSSASAPDALEPREIAALVNATASALGANCLPRSLVLCQLLRNRGIAADIRLGVAKPADGDLLAHAWVELDGLPLNDSLDVAERYAALPSPENGFHAGRS